MPGDPPVPSVDIPPGVIGGTIGFAAFTSEHLQKTLEIHHHVTGHLERATREGRIRILVSLAKLFDIDQEVVERLGG